ncbi:MAG TPA: quinol:electron acceptor oxidoreductase subunit ActD [Anaerolineales bacterium]|nr:quinol:electron acceptor oxidoreductase subunit ActD [Anaerolineales bacterium]
MRPTSRSDEASGTPEGSSVSLMGLFDEGTRTAEAIDALLAAGIAPEQMVVMSGVPYPEQALGRRREWLALPYIVLAGAASGFLFGLFLSVVTPHLYRLDVGGHPAVGFPPAAIIVFVFTMMATIVSTFLGVLWEMNFPRFGPAPYHKLVTDGNLALMLECSPSREGEVRQILQAHNAHHIGEPERMTL